MSTSSKSCGTSTFYSSRKSRFVSSCYQKWSPLLTRGFTWPPSYGEHLSCIGISLEAATFSVEKRGRVGQRGKEHDEGGRMAWERRDWIISVPRDCGTHCHKHPFCLIIDAYSKCETSSLFKATHAVIPRSTSITSQHPIFYSNS